MNGVSLDGGVEAQPLSVGEIFDRALTVYVKHWRPFTLLAALRVAPGLAYDLASIVAARNVARSLQGSGAASSHASAGAALQQIWMLMRSPYPKNDILLWTTIAAGFALSIVLYPAILQGLTDIRASRTTLALEWYRTGTRRIGSLFGVSALWLAALAAGVVAAFVLIFLIIIVVTISQGQIAALTPIIVSLVLVVFVPPWVLSHIPFAWSLFITAREGLPPYQSIVSAVRRSLGEGRFWRSTGITAGLLSLSLLLNILRRAAYALAVVFGATSLLFVALATLVDIAFFAYSTLVAAIYYLDALTRPMSRTSGEEAFCPYPK